MLSHTIIISSLMYAHQLCIVNFKRFKLCQTALHDCYCTLACEALHAKLLIVCIYSMRYLALAEATEN